MAFGETLTHLRKTKGLSQEQLAEELDLARQTISKWELNQSKPDFDYLLQLSDYFGVSIDYLIKGEQGDEPFCFDKTNLNSGRHSRIKLNKATAYKWCFCLGAVGMGISLLGIIAFVICSAILPHTAIVNGRTFEGLLGFIIGRHKLWEFMGLVLLFIAGCVLSVYSIIKRMKSEQ